MVVSLMVQSVTNQEIARYWKQRRLVEEDHLYAAMKAAARVRARNLSNDDYLKFECFLEEDDECKENENSSRVSCKDKSKEIKVGIKDWWTKSKYAYLNQPAMKLADNPRRQSCALSPHIFGYKSVSPLTQAHG